MSGSPVIGRCPVRSTLHSKRPTTAAQLKRCLGESWNAPQPLPVQVSELANAPGSGEFQLEAFQFTTDTGPQGEQPGWLLTENETDFGLLFNAKSDGPFVKVAFHDYVINKATDAVNPRQIGTKAAANDVLDIPAGASHRVTGLRGR